MSHLRWIHPLMLAASVVWAGTLQAQERGTVTGVVVDAATGAPMRGVHVAAGERRNTLTDDHGRFALCRLGPGLVMITAALHRYDSVTVAASTAEPAPVTLALTRDTTPPEPHPAALGGTRIILRPIDEEYQTIGYVIDGQRSVYSASGCGEPRAGIPVVEQVGVELHEIESLDVVKLGPTVSPDFGLSLHGILVITTNRARAP
jgi:hypothetical protein